METFSTKQVRLFRSKEKILSILDEYGKSNLSVKAFCDLNNIANGTFHNWMKKYGVPKSRPDRQTGFTALQITPSVQAIESALFAEVNGIKIYQPVEADYLKALLS
jgi:hypothetical protein